MGLVALLFLWPNCAKIIPFFPNYATFLKLCSLKKITNKFKKYILKLEAFGLQEETHQIPLTKKFKSTGFR